MCDWVSVMVVYSPRPLSIHDNEWAGMICHTPSLIWYTCLWVHCFAISTEIIFQPKALYMYWAIDLYMFSDYLYFLVLLYWITPETVICVVQISYLICWKHYDRLNIAALWRSPLEGLYGEETKMFPSLPCAGSWEIFQLHRIRVLFLCASLSPRCLACPFFRPLTQQLWHLVKAKL